MRKIIGIGASLLFLCTCGALSQKNEGRGRVDPHKQKIPQDVIREKGDLGAICKQIVDEKPTSGPLLSMAELKNRFLTGHNHIRKLYKLDPLIWDDAIAAYAQKWADHLKAHNGCDWQHRSKAGMLEGKNYGENLAWNWTSMSIKAGTYIESPEFALWGWSSECKDYSYADASCTPHEQCGHFTQIVWQKTMRVGCGMAVCDGAKTSKGVGRAEVWVCNYDPSGNVFLITKDGKKTPLKPF
jgi:pathogenesis-related protein 1